MNTFSNPGIEMLDPIVESTVLEIAPAPPRLVSFHGAVIGLFSNSKFNATKVLSMSSRLIQERFESAQFVLYEDDGEFGGLVGGELNWAEDLDAALLAIGD